MRSERGITLIALVITIIVMLILVAVTITMAVNGGLFDYAKKATQETNGAITNEQTLGSGQATVNGLNGGAAQDINGIVQYYTSN